MPHIEKLAIDVVQIDKNIYALEFPNLKVLELRIYEAQKFNNVIVTLANNMLKKGSLLRIICAEKVTGLNPS